MNDLDRKKVPLVSQGQELSLLDVESSFLANGVPTHIMNHGNQELMRIQFVFSGGKIFQAKPLLASSVNDLLIGGTQRLSSNEIAKQIENTGAYLETSVNKDIAMLSLYCLTGKRYVGYIEKLMLLVREVLFDASFPEKELEVYRKIKQQEFFDKQ